MKSLAVVPILLLLLLGVSFSAIAQDSEAGCLEKLSTAEGEFAAGRFYGIPSVVNDCIESGAFSNEQLVRVYLLLTQVYLLIDDPMGAERSYLKLLEADPEYVATEDKDPIDVYFLSKKFTSTPIFTPHFKAGLLQSRAVVIRDNNTFGNPATVNRTMVPQIGWHVGAGLEWNIDDNWGVGGELFLASKSFSINYNGAFGNDQLTTNEKQFWLDVPIYARYTDALGKFRPFAYVGHSLNFLLNSKVELSYTDIKSDGQVQVQGPDIDITYNRKFFNRGLLVGGGVKIKSGKNFLVADVRYMAGLSNISKGNYYDSGDSNDFVLFSGATRYASNSNDLRVNNFIISFGYVRPLYDPRKINKPRVKSLSKKASRNTSASDEKN